LKTGVVIFPGSNCDQDCLDVTERIMGWEAIGCWHRDALPSGLDLVILPGGFSHGDYLRAGAIAARAPVMADVARFAHAGGPVLGICNGFQVLCEAGLLPGALRINRDLTFHCEDVWLRVERRDTPFTSACPERVRIPIAHREGNYFADRETLARLEGEGRVLFRYEQNPNGSVNDIAGIMSEASNVCGMMPHPERVSEEILGGTDGRSVFESLAMATGVVN
jgi:phosphoribosylformylglycinamidine synthase subunit PurQ / glutaminase